MPTSLFIPWFELKPWLLFGHIKLQPFGLLVAIGILFGSRVAEWRAERRGVPRYVVADFLVTTVITGLLVCMVLNVALYEPEKFVQMGRAIASWVAWVFGKGEALAFPYPGLSSFGGFLGGVAAAVWYRQRKRVSLLVLGDIFCFAFPFAWIFGRSGCFSVHDHPGLVTDFFLAVDDYNGQGLPRHDLGLYEVIWSACMIPLVLWLDRKPRPWGFFMALLPILYAPVRFGLDFLREDAEHGGDVRYLGLTPGHYYAVFMLLAGIAVAIRVKRGPQPTLMLDGSTPEPPPDEGKPAGRASKPPDAKRSKRRRA